MKLAEKVFQLGNWSSVDDLEDSITLNELHRLFITAQEKEHNQRMFEASLKGIKMDPWVDPDDEPVRSFEDIKAEAERKAAMANGDLDAEAPTEQGADGFGFEIDGED